MNSHLFIFYTSLAGMGGEGVGLVGEVEWGEWCPTCNGDSKVGMGRNCSAAAEGMAPTGVVPEYRIERDV